MKHLAPGFKLQMLIEVSLPIYIKYMAMANACGDSSPLVYILAVEEMREDIFEVREIIGMCTTANVNCIVIYFSAKAEWAINLFGHGTT